MVIDGSTVSGNRVEIDVGSLSVESRQDTSTETGDDDSWGVQTGYALGSGGFTLTGNRSSAEQDGALASVEQLVATICCDAGSVNPGGQSRSRPDPLIFLQERFESGLEGR